MRVLLFVLWLVCACSGAQAQLSVTGVGGGGFGGVGVCTGYTGPNDTVSGMTHYYGLRGADCVIVQAGTQKLVNVSASGTTPANVTCDIIVAAGGGLGNTANCSTGTYNGTAAATFCATGSGSCTVATWYDQIGTANMSQATSASRPALTFSCNGSLPCIVFNKSNSQILTGGATIGSTSAFTISFWVVDSAYGTCGCRITSNDHTDSDNNGFQIEDGSTTFYAGNGSTNVSVSGTNSSPSAWYYFNGLVGSADIYAYTNGSLSNTTAFTPPMTAGSGNLAVGGGSYLNDYWSGDMFEIYTYSATLTGTQISNLYALGQ